ncbi:2OG-Fe(II) oxygenase [Marinomonas sp. S3726]|uniref:2OG-Fe(II) oxygenase n=1 Tax=Marinomonas sp. S3726 TaxID=579484 RepID=UPI0005F9FA4B|nr:2OG-Fe(II) oxygenase [Marinomonas sp. S3726]KJZ13838.1 2OG-Fe(II) oxygenase [Marinomonas sp. S3726]
MTKTTTLNLNETSSRLVEARELALPSRQEMLSRLPSVERFWDKNRDLLVDAWKEWEESNKAQLIALDDSVIDKNLRDAVNQAWFDPTTESNVSDLWNEVAPGVFLAQFFDKEQVAILREFLEEVANANIPLRPPYGISLNRYGAMLDPRSDGYLAAPEFQAFYNQLLDKYMRPVARMLFPEVMGYDSQTFGFSIKWQAGMDTSLRLHTDASAVTMNINMNLEGEAFTGSEVDFYDPSTGKLNRLSFEAGTAMIHRGNVAHAAQPITSGERSNMVLWLYGNSMQVPQASKQTNTVDAAKRWTTSTEKKDRYAPF